MRMVRILAAATDHNMCRHLWYLGEELIGLSLFDDRISDDQKTATVQGMKTCPASNSSKRLDEKKIDLAKPLSYWCA